MTKGRREAWVTGSDGLIARNSGIWAKDKLSFLDEFGPHALLATRKKRQRWYVDLFAGPGVNVDHEDTHQEFEGAALRALKMVAPSDPSVHFTDMVLVIVVGSLVVAASILGVLGARPVPVPVKGEKPRQHR